MNDVTRPTGTVKVYVDADGYTGSYLEGGMPTLLIKQLTAGSPQARAFEKADRMEAADMAAVFDEDRGSFFFWFI